MVRGPYCTRSLTQPAHRLIGLSKVQGCSAYETHTLHIQEPLHEKRHRVDELLEMLALQSCKDVFIGDALSRGISGGQVGWLIVRLLLFGAWSQPPAFHPAEPEASLMGPCSACSCSCSGRTFGPAGRNSCLNLLNC